MKVYVVLGETGEYSDRSVRVCGVFATEDEARAAMIDRMAIRRVYDQWHDRMLSELRKLQPGGLARYTNENQREAKLRAGPEPEIEYSERVHLHVGELGIWGAEYGGLPELDPPQS